MNDLLPPSAPRSGGPWLAGGGRAALDRLAAATLRVHLSAREQEVLLQIAAGDSNKVIARSLDLSTHTVKRHVANILDKVGASSRGQAAAWLHAQH